MKERKIEVLHNQVPFGYTVNNDGTVKIYKGKREEPKDYSISEIAKMCGVNYHKAYNTARKIEDLLNPNMENNQKRYSEFDKNIILKEIRMTGDKAKDIKYYSTKEAAEMLNVSRSTVNKLINKGKIPAIKIEDLTTVYGYRWFIEEKDLNNVKETSGVPGRMKNNEVKKEMSLPGQPENMDKRIESLTKQVLDKLKDQDEQINNLKKQVLDKLRYKDEIIHDLIEEVYDLKQNAGSKKKRFSFFGLLK